MEQKLILKNASFGKILLVEAATQLNLQDAGYVLKMLAAENLPLPQLSEVELKRQAAESFEALKECLKIPQL